MFCFRERTAETAKRFDGFPTGGFSGLLPRLSRCVSVARLPGALASPGRLGFEDNYFCFGLSFWSFVLLCPFLTRYLGRRRFAPRGRRQNSANGSRAPDRWRTPLGGEERLSGRPHVLRTGGAGQCRDPRGRRCLMVPYWVFFYFLFSNRIITTYV